MEITAGEHDSALFYVDGSLPQQPSSSFPHLSFLFFILCLSYLTCSAPPPTPVHAEKPVASCWSFYFTLTSVGKENLRKEQTVTFNL